MKTWSQNEFRHFKLGGCLWINKFVNPVCLLTYTLVTALNLLVFIYFTLYQNTTSLKIQQISLKYHFTLTSWLNDKQKNSFHCPIPPCIHTTIHHCLLMIMLIPISQPAIIKEQGMGYLVLFNHSLILQNHMIWNSTFQTKLHSFL